MTFVLRPARSGDALIIREWQQDPETRRFARSPSVPSEAAHLAWYARKIASPDCQFLIIDLDGVPAGLLRLDRCDEEWELSIVVAPNNRRCGVGRTALVALDGLRLGRKFVAEVLPGNEVSHRLFRAAGWRADGDRIYRKP